MSANNWSKCPRCLSEAEQETTNRHDKAARAYGKVPLEKYTRLCQRAAEDLTPDDTLREDYGIGIRDGTFAVDYHALCTKCGYSFTFKTTKEATWQVDQEAVVEGDE